MTKRVENQTIKRQLSYSKKTSCWYGLFFLSLCTVGDMTGKDASLHKLHVSGKFDILNSHSDMDYLEL